jgi:hypothetical protein
MPDKRRWTTEAQRTFLTEYVPRYIEAQASRKFHKFWPILYQDWFAKFPEGEPTEDDPTDSETELNSEPEADADSGSESNGTAHSGSKRKRSDGKSRGKKVAKVISLSFDVCVSC